MYKQASIRHQKRHDWQSALMWAERGLALYGTEAARPEDVDDLKKRATMLRSKLPRRT
jgi:hypothetical protein